MKYILTFLLFLVVSFAAEAADKTQFENVLKSFNASAAHISSTKSYEKLTFTNKETKETKKWSDFSEEDRAIFMLMGVQKFGFSLSYIYEKWEEELKNAPEFPEEATEASKKDIEKYMSQLLALRKKNAAILEKMATELFDKYPKLFSSDEKDHIINSIKEFHDKHKLMPRE